MPEPCPPFRNPSLPPSERVADLVSRLSREEKLGLMASMQEAIPRLGIEEFHIGGEAAHGLQSPCGPATVFPQTLGLACSWDSELLERIGSAIGDEARAYYRKREGIGGLCLWAPTIDMERDPRWGRTEEAYGEDPCLGGRLSSAYLRGMQGDLPFFLKTLPTPKHFFGNNNEAGRGSRSASIDPRSRREYYLAAFESALREAGAQSLMTAYNAINGVPAILNPDIQEVVRGEWGFSGFVVCDAGSLAMLVSEHRFCPDLAHAAAAAVKAGVDNFSEESGLVVAALRGALDAGLLAWADIDRCLARVLRARLRLGQFEPPESRPYDSIGEAAIWDGGHRELALRAARESIVLLENRGILPLGAGDVAAIGPLAAEVYRDWYAGTPAYRVGPLEALARRLGSSKVGYAEGADAVVLRCRDGRSLGCRAWFDGRLAARRCEGGERFLLRDWGWGNVTLRSLTNGRFVTEVEGRLEASAGEVWGWNVRERFALEEAGGSPGKVYLRASSGGYVGLDADGMAVVCGAGRGDGAPQLEPFAIEIVRDGIAEAARAAAAADTALVFVGNHPLLVAKEEIDREDIGLAPEQVKMIEAAIAVNPRTVVIVVGGYPFALGDWKDRAAAVIYAAHGGQEAGNALADALLGAYNPAGRLPMTWYRSLDQIGGIMDYDIARGKRTYRYFEGAPLYPFGYGLSYSRFEYEAEGGPIADGRGGLSLRVRVSNAEGPDGEEVVQLYGACGASAVRRPRSQLFDFRRVAIPRGGSAVVELRARARDFAFWDVRTGDWFLESGAWELRVGPSSAEVRLLIPFRVEGEALPPRDIGGWTAASSFDDDEGAILDWSPSGEVVRAAEGRDSVLLRFDDADFGPGGRCWAEFQCTADGPGARVSLSTEGSAGVSVETQGGGTQTLRGSLVLPAGCRGFDLRLEKGLRLIAFRFVHGDFTV